MAKKQPNSSGTSLRVIAVSIKRPASVPTTSRDGLANLELSIEVENVSAKALYVWTSRRSYSYNNLTNVLTVYLAEPEEQLPANIKMLSDHAHTPAQAAVDARSRVTIEVAVPASTRRFTPGKGLGQSFVEDPIGQIAQVEIHLQFAVVPIKSRVGENPSDYRKRLRAHGEVVTAEVTPTIEKEK
ncbi:MAG: hypothetical protein ABSG69_09835 [Candidatus Acidiferrum sp.]|jgi:hypothetical protein